MAEIDIQDKVPRQLFQRSLLAKRAKGEGRVAGLWGFFAREIFMRKACKGRRTNGDPPEIRELLSNPVVEESVPGAECAICLTSFEEGKDLVSPSLSGRHWFHFECLASWLRNSGTDPMTRGKYL